MQKDARVGKTVAKYATDTSIDMIGSKIAKVMLWHCTRGKNFKPINDAEHPTDDTNTHPITSPMSRLAKCLARYATSSRSAGRAVSAGSESTREVRSERRWRPTRLAA